MEELTEMLRKEFDLKATIISQYNGTAEKRKLIIYTWIMQPYINDSFIENLPKAIN